MKKSPISLLKDPKEMFVLHLKPYIGRLSLSYALRGEITSSGAKNGSCGGEGEKSFYVSAQIYIWYKNRFNISVVLKFHGEK